MKYRNPILKGDYSDPDVIRVGEYFYMVSSSFTYLPGIPVMRSKNLVSWQTVGYAAARLPFERYDMPAHRRGTWAPSIRFYDGVFYVYVCLPDEGLLAFTSKDPSGEWSVHRVKDVVGWIDPCPFRDDDGSAYIVHGFAASRIGINNILYLHKTSSDGLSVLDKGRLVYNGDDFGDVTVEGPKMYKRCGYYYILCPAGGVKGGYQLALRSKNIYGPYERRVTLSQGDTLVNGPHQGGWVEDTRGNGYFMHFQDMGAYGRITHLQPVKWVDGWPEMGERGQPVLTGDAPDVEGDRRARPDMSDDFHGGMSMQWQWQANPNPDWREFTGGGLRLRAFPADSLFMAGQFLSQLMQSYNFDMDVLVRASMSPGDRAGLAAMGCEYGYIALERDSIVFARGIARNDEIADEQTVESVGWPTGEALLRLSVRNGLYRFYYGENADSLKPLGGESALSAGGWVGARPGIFCMNLSGVRGGYADFEYVRVNCLDDGQ